MLRTLAVAAAKRCPQSIKNWVHRDRQRDWLTRRLFGALLGGGTTTILSGPMAGIHLVNGPQVSHAHLTGTYELDTLKAVEEAVKPGFVCYDLGASIGYISLLMARKARQVFAFEPAPHAVAELRRHAAANGFENIVVVPSPLSDGDRDVSFVLTDAAFGSSINESETRWPVLKLRTTTLDRFIENNPPPDFIKMDVEGEEGRVLEGSRNLLSRHHPVICCELHSDEAAAHVQKVLSEYGYSITDLEGRPFSVRSGIIAGEVQVMCRPVRG
jgi:FkbM family methyltransferase